MAARLLATLLVQGAGVVFRAATQAYQQAIVNGTKAGVGATASRMGARTGMSTQEAQMILQVEKGATWDKVEERYKHLFKLNQEHGSFYLLSKVYRAREALAKEYNVDISGEEHPLSKAVEDAKAKEGAGAAGEDGKKPQE
mmetsp:Transcript_21207/g.67128  ORF Transcript_21207/g.67128 Transcript_21207/m.67128 type:complete len:141 (+) Transcript_21207:178-600(+)